MTKSPMSKLCGVAKPLGIILTHRGLKDHQLGALFLRQHTGRLSYLTLLLLSICACFVRCMLSGIIAHRDARLRPASEAHQIPD